MIHLHVHTSYSFLDGFGTSDQYITRLKELGQTAMAVTDHGNIFAHRDFWPKFDKAGLKYIPGCELYVRNPKDDEKYFHLTVLAASNEGYSNLCRIVTLANQEDHFNRRPQVIMDEIYPLSKGLIILTGCFGDGILHRAYHQDRDSVMDKLKIFLPLECPFYLEIQQINNEEREFFRVMSRIAGIPCVPTLDCHYPHPLHEEFEDMALCIGMKEKMSNPNRIKLPPRLYLHSEQEVLDMGFTQEEVNMTHEIAERCNATWTQLEPLRLDGARDKMISIIREQVKRLGSEVKHERYRERYRYEMSVIDKLGLHSYFVIMSDVITEFKRRGMLIGPARGSSAGSLVCFLMAITEVDPVANGLLFERFLDLNRKDYPDIDTDFPQGIRSQVVSYLSEKYGSDRIGHICSYSSYKGASVFHDLARVFGVGTTVASELGKSVPNIVNDSIDLQDIIDTPALQPILSRYPVFRKVVGLEGQFRQLGQHASGYAISPVPLSEIVAQAKTKDGHVISVNKDQAEGMGLLKLDILGLKTLDILQDCCAKTGTKIDKLYRMVPNDPKIFAKFNTGEVSGVFQFDGGAVRRALAQFSVSTLDDLSFINAVARPGASNALTGRIAIPQLLSRFFYKGKYFVYQEELMAVLRFIEFGWDDVTKIRKMVSKKQVTQLEEKYMLPVIQGMIKKGISEKEATDFWAVMLKCGEYLFNRSHAVAYAMVAYYCVWFKVYHPDAFLESYCDHTDDDVKRRMLIREYIRQGYRYSVMGGVERFKIMDRKLCGPMLAIKGIGPAKLEKYVKTGKMDKGMEWAMGLAESHPAEYAPWACFDGFQNPAPFQDLEDGEYLLNVRLWNPKDGKCYIEDKRSCVKAYYDPRYVKPVSGKAYEIIAEKHGYFKIIKLRKEMQ